MTVKLGAIDLRNVGGGEGGLFTTVARLGHLTSPWPSGGDIFLMVAPL